MILDYLWQIIVACIVCYVLSAINYSVIISKTFLHSDIRKLGSGNPGTTNMFRNFGLRWGLLTFVLDMSKGLLSAGVGWVVFIAITGDAELSKTIAYMCGCFSVAGHIFPFELHFKGGKGLATTLGVLLILQPILALISFGIILLAIIVTDRMSIGSLLTSAVYLAYHLIVFIPLANWYIVGAVSLNVALVVFAHRSNIRRLIQGKENPTGVRKVFAKKSNQDKK